MTLSKQEIQSRKADLLGAGFSIDFVEKNVVSKRYLPKRSVGGTIEFLLARGFKNPTKLITSMPAILSLSLDNIDAKIKGLKARGFKNPTKLITSLPTILGYGFDNIDAKIEGLKVRDFKNPIKLIISSPQILSYSFDNIDWRLRYFRRLFNLCNSDVNAQDVMETCIALWSTKREKMQIIARIAYNLNCKAEKSVISALLCNLENFLLVYIYTKEKDFRTIRLRAKKAKSKYGTVKERREKIQEFSDKLPSKVYSLYCKGYIR